MGSLCIKEIAEKVAFVNDILRQSFKNEEKFGFYVHTV